MTHILDDARGQMREGHTSAQWELVAREKVARTLLETREFTADVLSEVNMPTEYRQHVHGAVTGFFAGVEHFMDFVGRQKSSRPSRKGGKNDLYRISTKGLRELPGLLRDPHSRLYTLAGSSEKEIAGIDVDHHGDGEGALSIGVDAPAVGVDPGDAQSGVGSPAVTKRDEVSSSPCVAADSGASPDSLIQLDPPKGSTPSAYDCWEGEAA